VQQQLTIILPPPRNLDIQSVRHRQKADLEKFAKFRSAKVALYMKAACLVLSFYSLKISEILRVSSVSVLFSAVSEVLDDLGFT